MIGKLIYLASPFTHKNKSVMEERFWVVSEVAGRLTKERNVHLYCPIAMGWPIAQKADLPTDWNYWQHNCKVFISRCQELWVVMIDGWKESTGVQAEIEYAKSIGISVKYVYIGGYEPIIYEETECIELCLI